MKGRRWFDGLWSKTLARQQDWLNKFRHLKEWKHSIKDSRQASQNYTQGNNPLVDGRRERSRRAAEKTRSVWLCISVIQHRHLHKRSWEETGGRNAIQSCSWRDVLSITKSLHCLWHRFLLCFDLSLHTTEGCCQIVPLWPAHTITANTKQGKGERCDLPEPKWLLLPILRLAQGQC